MNVVRHDHILFHLRSGKLYGDPLNPPFQDLPLGFEFREGRPLPYNAGKPAALLLRTEGNKVQTVLAVILTRQAGSFTLRLHRGHRSFAGRVGEGSPLPLPCRFCIL